MHPYSTTDRNYRSNSSQHMAHSPRDYQSSLSSIASKPTPTLYGVKCTEVSQKAYTGQTSAMKAGFKRLQRLDSGKVEYRTIAFCTHLTVSRWETTTPNGNTNNVSTSSSEESAGAASSSSRNNPSHAAQLMSLANYIRHILSLTAGNSNTPPHQGNQPQQHDDSSNKQSISKNNHTPPSTQELHTSSSRSLKVLSNKRQRHRYSPEYHDHGGQRHSRHNQESYDQGYQEGHQHKAPPQFPPQDQNQPQFNNQQSQGTSYRFRSPSNTKASDVLRHFPQPINTSRTSPPLLRVPFPNLTLTLALIYVDRLKAKNPEAKGEPGCSHRLFLIAFIIAAKYRCSVALSPSFSEQETSENSENSLFYDPPVVPEEDDVEEEQSLESRLNSELIFSNHAWVRLLNLGSFARTSPSDTPTHSGSGVEQTLPNSPSGNGPSSPMSTVPSSPQTNDDATSTRASNTPVPTTPTHGQTPSQAQMHPQQLQNFSSIMHSATSGAISSAGSPALQVEDLDRMEAEFLTFLNFDLATMTHDLETCWNLLVGKKD
ncbi:hypothetical protein FBU30_002325 [Linnemannia zychae]|nr:hypothetical protein FBU30_002325 [Linnemannia zychae]